MPHGVTGREIAIGPQRVKRDVELALKKSLSQGNPQGLPVNVSVRLTSIWLVSPGQKLVFGGTSAVNGDITITSSVDGSVVTPTRDVRGVAKRFVPDGLIGAIATKNPLIDYQNVVKGFAERIGVGVLNTTSEPIATGTPENWKNEKTGQSTNMTPQQIAWCRQQHGTDFCAEG
jgi:hypothetical protein